MADEYALGILKGKIRFDVSTSEMEKLKSFKKASEEVKPAIKQTENLMKQIPIMGKFFKLAKGAIGPLGLTAAAVGGAILLARSLGASGQVAASFKDSLNQMKDAVDDVILAKSSDNLIARMREMGDRMKILNKAFPSQEELGLITGIFAGVKQGSLIPDFIAAEGNLRLAEASVRADQNPVMNVVNKAAEFTSDVAFSKSLDETAESAFRLRDSFGELAISINKFTEGAIPSFGLPPMTGYARGESVPMTAPEEIGMRMAEAFERNLNRLQSQRQTHHTTHGSAPQTQQTPYFASFFTNPTPGKLNVQGSSYASLLP